MLKRALFKSKSQARAVGASACIYKANRQNEKPDARHTVKKLQQKKYFFKKLYRRECKKKIDRRERLKQKARFTLRSKIQYEVFCPMTIVIQNV